jgi:pyruvate formate lyase activating enzyme
MKKGLIFDIKRYAIHDGPGIRTTIFFKGCFLHCWWCHNPEGQSSELELIYKRNRCINCEECIEICPRGALSRINEQICIDRDKCDLCGECTQVCSGEALEIIGKEMTVEEVMEEIKKDKIFYDESKGGVTFSGGEPFLQIDFLKALLKECKKEDIHTTVDTCGYGSYEAFKEIKDYVNLFLYDIKLMDDKRHIEYTGVSNKLILDNLKKLAKDGANIEIRFPIIPEINDDMDNVRNIADFLSSLYVVKNISLLPYHRAGIEKYEGLNKKYKMKDIKAVSNMKVKSIKEFLENSGFKVKIGG